MSDRSPFPEPHIPDVALHRYVLEHARRHGDKLALVDAERGTAFSYASLAERVAAVASRLRQRGMRAGEVVALTAPNRPEWVAAFFGVLEAGGIVQPLNPALTRDEMAKQLRQAQAHRIVTSDDIHAKAQAAGAVADLRHIDALERLTAPATTSGQKASTSPNARATAVLASSSGTTGFPKTVMLSHRNLVANLEQHRPVHHVAEDDVVCAVLPFFHIYGLTIVLSSALRHGATVVTLPRFELAKFLACIQEHHVTRLYLAPPVVTALATAPEVDAYDLSSLRVAACGAAPLSPDLARRAVTRIGCPILQGYGMTEASPGTHYTPEDRIDDVPTESVGYLLPGTEARLVAAAPPPDHPTQPSQGAVERDEPQSTREDVPAEQLHDADSERGGELWVRGPQIMQGYLNDPEATAASLTRDGWLRTGDIVRRDSGGVYFVIDRLKELIKYKGYQVAPAELEALLRTHPKLRDAAVVGLPDAAVGEIPTAYIVSDDEIDESSLMAWVAERVAPYKKIRAVRRVERIPRSPAGKILRRVLRAQATDGPT